MHNYSDSIILKNIKSINTNISVARITALWAFSESAFGGILHALSIPFRGLFINAAAVLFISLIALFSKSSKDILKSTLIVILIKAVVSPYTPLAAYLAVSIQGILGYLFFLQIKYFRTSALLLGTITVLFSGLQKIILLTILFGNTLWKSINIFIKQVSKEIFSIDNPDINYGYLLVSIYLFIHLAAGIFIGIYAGFLPIKIIRYSKNVPVIILENLEDTIPQKDKKRKKKIWLLRPTGIFVLIVSAGVIIFSYLSPTVNDNAAVEIMIMIIRSIVLTIIWFVIIAPAVKKIFQKYLSKRKSNYTKELDEIINMFPQFNKIVAYCWIKSSDKKGFKRIHYFLSTSFYYLLLSK